MLQLGLFSLWMLAVARGAVRHLRGPRRAERPLFWLVWTLTMLAGCWHLAGGQLAPVQGFLSLVFRPVGQWLLQLQRNGAGLP